MTEHGDAPSVGEGCEGASIGPVWTDTRNDGTLYNQDYSCDDWTKTSGETVYLGAFGSDLGWSGSCSCGFREQPVCSSTAALYCFEQ